MNSDVWRELPEVSVGAEVSFVYNELPRKGKIDKVGSSYLTLEMDPTEDKDRKVYKSFSFTGITKFAYLD